MEGHVTSISGSRHAKEAGLPVADLLRDRHRGQMNLLYRWFIDLSLDGNVWDATTFTKNRERFEKHGLLRKFFDRLVEQALVEEWASSEDFTVDGSLIESYPSMKSVRPKESAETRVPARIGTSTGEAGFHQRLYVGASAGSTVAVAGSAVLGAIALWVAYALSQSDF